LGASSKPRHKRNETRQSCIKSELFILQDEVKSLDINPLNFGMKCIIY
jgi:hypothetical protein